MFHTSTPVVGEKFHNRATELAQLARSIEKLSVGAPQWVAIIGPPRPLTMRHQFKRNCGLHTEHVEDFVEKRLHLPWQGGFINRLRDRHPRRVLEAVRPRSRQPVVARTIDLLFGRSAAK